MGVKLVGVVRCDDRAGVARVQCPASFQAQMEIRAVIDRGGAIEIVITPDGPYPEGWTNSVYSLDSWYCPEHKPR